MNLPTELSTIRHEHPQGLRSTYPGVVCMSGSRDWDDWDLIHDVLEGIPTGVQIVVGDARGADREVLAFGEFTHMDVHVFKADWDRLGKRAGIVRNNRMLDHALHVIAFWKGNSRGTAHTITEAKRRGLPVDVYWRP